MESKTVSITDQKLVAKLTKLWDGKAGYVMDYPRQYRVIITDNGAPKFYTDAEDPAGFVKQAQAPEPELAPEVKKKKSKSKSK